MDGERVKTFFLRGGLSLIYILHHIIDIVLYPFYGLYYQPWKTRKYRRNVHAHENRSKDCIIYETNDPERNEAYQSLCKSNVDTLLSVFDHTTDKYGNRECLGTREVFSEEDEMQSNGKVFKKYIMGDYKFTTYDGFREKAYSLARGFRSLGLKPRCRIAMLAETREEWMVSIYAAFKNNYTVVTLYTNLGEEGIVHGLNETEVSVVVCSHELLPKVKRVLKDCSFIKFVVVMEACTGKKSDLSLDHKTDVGFIMFKDLCQRKSDEERYPSPTPSDIAIIMYTSGSTGTPKGVLISHKNALAGLKALSNYTIFHTWDRYLAYLPLAHIMEIVAETLCLYCGMKIGYSSPLTLTNKSSKIKKGCKGDANVFRPTLMCSVPLMLERIHKTILDTVRRQGWAAEELFNYFLAYKMKWLYRGFDTPLLNKTLFRKLRYFIGGRVRILLNGGAPISHDTQSITMATLSVPVIQAYGLTELSGASNVSNIYDRTTCRVGPPLIDYKIKLVNWEEGNYSIDDKPFPRGEIHIGGESICQGYFKNPKKTAEDFYEEDGVRWFKTGDIGHMEPDGVLRIIDRKKDLVKLSGGEYISYGKVESIIKTCPLIENICTYADPLKGYLFAVLIPDRAQLTERNIGLDNLLNEDSIQKALTKEIADYGLKNGLVRFELPGKILFVGDEWTTENGLITAAFKTRRRQIVDHYKNKIDELYT